MTHPFDLQLMCLLFVFICMTNVTYSKPAPPCTDLNVCGKHGTYEVPTDDDVDKSPYCSCDEGFSGKRCEEVILRRCYHHYGHFSTKTVNKDDCPTHFWCSLDNPLCYIHNCETAPGYCLPDQSVDEVDQQYDWCFEAR